MYRIADISLAPEGEQKIEWVRLRERHPKAYEAAKALEKDALEHGSPFTWSKGESLKKQRKS